MKCIFTLLLFFLAFIHCWAKSFLFPDVNDLNVVKVQLTSDKPTPESTLIIFDIDDTLLEASNFVGSTKWYNWQRGKMVQDHKGQSLTIKQNEQYACIFRTLGTLFEMGTFHPTQNDVDEIVNHLKLYDMMLLTARTATFRASTERALQANAIDVRDEHLPASSSRLAFEFNDGYRSAKVTYENGLVMASGLNKGKVLDALLAKLKRSYEHIYFVDDDEKNITDVETEWKNRDEAMTIFHYTRVSKQISPEEIKQSNKAKARFDQFIALAYPDRFAKFKQGHCG